MRSPPCSSWPRPTPTPPAPPGGGRAPTPGSCRGAALPVPDRVRAGRVRQLRAIGPGRESRLRELIETGQIAELAELERELAPDLVGLGRYLGLSAKRSI